MKKKIIMRMIVSTMLFTLIGAEKKADTGKYTIIINGYDWGPAVDKVVIPIDYKISTDQILLQDFVVTAEIQVYKRFSSKLKTVKGHRTINSMYISDETGNRKQDINSSENNYMTLEMQVHPDDPFSSPFIYMNDGFNHWRPSYKLKIENKKLGIRVQTEKSRICPYTDQFTIGKKTYNSVEINYASWIPENTNKDSKIPLIIWLHGMGEGGVDPYITLLGNKVVNLITPAVQNCFKDTGAAVLVPQIDGSWLQTQIEDKNRNTWVGEKSVGKVSCYTKTLFKLIDKYIEENPCIDRNCIYIGGCSNGGYMTLNMLLEYPEYFAAAFPVCEIYPDSLITDQDIITLSKQHIWFTQSFDDKTVISDKYVLPTFQRLQKAGADDIHLTLWDNVVDTTGLYKTNKGTPYVYYGHFSWIYTLNNECKENDQSLFEWLGKQNRGQYS